MLRERQELVEQLITPYFGGSTKQLHFRRTGGGSINETFEVSIPGQRLFCKLNSAALFPQLFEKEMKGLEMLRGKTGLHVPEVIACEHLDGVQVLILEWIEETIPDEKFWTVFGEELARLHSIKGGQFGSDEDNYMGSVYQSNRKHQDWISFFQHERLEPLVKKCGDKNLLSPKDVEAFEKLYKELPGIFESRIQPSLVHGDLWSGNFMCGNNSQPVLIDPAAYYGHPSVDLGMTTLFGGFHPSFYQAYREHSALPPNYQEQWMACNLYPLLIHLFLFGFSYKKQIEESLKRLANG
jgi:protein-ribulosamine 3-kinase